jgi:hypothetical protein
MRYKVKYSDPKDWGSNPPFDELLNKSGMDIIMVLGSSP